MLTTLEIKILAGVALLALLCVGVWLYNKHEQQIGAAVVHAEQLQKDLDQAKVDRIESDRRVTTIQEKANVADQRASAAVADVAAARTAGERLRVRLAAAERARVASNPAAAGASTPAGDTPGFVPYDVFERVRGAAGQFAAFADDLGIRLDACVGSYQSLTPNSH